MNSFFKPSLEIIKDSINSINEDSFSSMLQDCYCTLKGGHKIIASGLGKNVPICDKFVGTMLSMGMDASFLHTNSAVHGDMGMVKSCDLVIMLSKSGATSESVYLADLLKKRGGGSVKLWLITFSEEGVMTRIIGKEHSLVIRLSHEGDQWNIVPNHSTTVNLIVLQTLAMELSKMMNVSLEDFKENHPGGAIGKYLNKNV